VARGARRGRLPRRRRAAARIDVRVVLDRRDQACTNRGLVDQELAFVVHQLDTLSLLIDR
jgi:hypothetical protein